MPLPRYSLDDGGDEDEVMEESYTSNASTSRLPAPSASPSRPSGAGFNRSTPSYLRSDSHSAYDAPSSLDIDALLPSTPASDRPTSKPYSSSSAAVRLSPSSTSSAGTGWPYSPTSPLGRTTPFEQLTLFMSTQKSAPELLPFPTDAFERLVAQMEQQQSILDSLLHLAHSAGTDEIGGEEGEAGMDEDEFVRLNLVQVDLERCKWLLKHIVRCRMDLLQKYAAFVHARPSEMSKLNATESRFVTEYWQLKKEHFHSSVLGFLPEALHDLAAGQPEDTASQPDQTPNNNSNNMVPGPDLDAPVFIRCLEDCGSVSLPDGEQAALSNESVHLLRYRSIRHLVYQGSIVLL